MRTWIVLHLSAFVLVFLCAPELAERSLQWLVAGSTALCMSSVFVWLITSLPFARFRKPGVVAVRALSLLLLLPASGVLHGGLRLAMHTMSTAPLLISAGNTIPVAGISADVSGYFCEPSLRTRLDIERTRQQTRRSRPRSARLCFEVITSSATLLKAGTRLNLRCTSCIQPLAGQGYALTVRLRPSKRRLHEASEFMHRYRQLRRPDPLEADLLDEPVVDVELSQRSEQMQRQALRDSLLLAVEGSPHRASYHALVIGDRSGLDFGQRQQLASSGLSHLLVISGLHVGLMAALVAWTFRALAKALGFRRWRVPVLLFTAVGLLGYLWLVDYAVPVLRASIMALLFIALAIGRRPVVVMDYWLITLCACLFIDPFAFVDAGFWLSFGAVGVIALLLSGRTKRLKPPVPTAAGASRIQQTSAAVRVGASHLRHVWWPAFWHIQWQLYLTLGIVIGYLFGTLSLAGLFTNLIAIPLVTLLLVPLTVLGLGLSLAGLPASPLLDLTDSLFDCFWWLAASGAYFPALSIKPIGADVVFLLLLLSIPTLCCWRAPFAPWLFASKLLLLSGIASSDAAPPPALVQEGLRFIVFDAGQGHSAMLDDGQTRLLFDTGPVFPISKAFSGGRDSGWKGAPFSPAKDQVLPMLAAGQTVAAEQPRLDYLIVSHADHDHAGGSAFLLQHTALRYALSGEPEKLNGIVDEELADLEPADDAHQRFSACVAGQRIQSAGFSIEVLWPFPASAESGLSGNDLSCVLMVVTANHRILLTGDAEKPALQQIVARYGSSLKADILVLPHHGSRSSFLPAFISAVQPEQAIVPAGLDNRFGHPHIEPIDWLRRRGVEIWDTGELGYFELNEPLRP